MYNMYVVITYFVVQQGQVRPKPGSKFGLRMVVFEYLNLTWTRIWVTQPSQNPKNFSFSQKIGQKSATIGQIQQPKPQSEPNPCQNSRPRNPTCSMKINLVFCLKVEPYPSVLLDFIITCSLQEVSIHFNQYSVILTSFSKMVEFRNLDIFILTFKEAFWRF